jgi:hypothetical protein
MATIPIDRLVEELSNCLNDINDKLKGRFLTHQNAIKNEYGEEIAALSSGRLLSIKSARIQISGKPVIEHEKARGITIPKLHLAFGNFDQSKGITLEIVLGTDGRKECECDCGRPQ